MNAPSTHEIGRIARPPQRSRRFVTLPWGAATDKPEQRGLTALAFDAAGLEHQIGHSSSRVQAGQIQDAGSLDERLHDLKTRQLRRRALDVRSRQWLAHRALHQASWGENLCVDHLGTTETLQGVSTAAVAERVASIARTIETVDEQKVADPLPWQGGLYCGLTRSERATVGVQIPVSGVVSGLPAAELAAVRLGRPGTPGLLEQRLFDRSVSWYSAASVPVSEHGTRCVHVAVSTVPGQVREVVSVVLDLILECRSMVDAEPFLISAVHLHRALSVNDNLDGAADLGADGPPAVAVIGELDEATLAWLKEAVDDRHGD